MEFYNIRYVKIKCMISDIFEVSNETICFYLIVYNITGFFQLSYSFNTFPKCNDLFVTVYSVLFVHFLSFYYIFALL